ncbi:rRNA N6-adenosine-methyltransferase METTL5-like [Panonychus citri]|uniref:rRNA N6-adenosine-methyltransferase METTL5-like n=1 Tax=Panonychus citri TaxID=50023 RepID=UPI0023079B20|nr:rRNA N6-adenosine-methyltransferase METTL5-like [Panonychus citri]
MNLKQLESILDDFDDFDEPNILFEQYVTPGYVAARMLHTISLDDHIKGKTIVDLGTGPGILAIGSALLGADYVVGVDLDENVFQIAKSNLEELDELFPGKPPIDFVHDDVTKCSLEKKSFDVAIFNPPFGTKGNSGIDIEFLKVALNLTRESVYSLHKSATRSFILKKGEQFGVKSEVLGRFSYDLPATYARHTKANKTIDVDLFRFTHKK